MKVFTADFETTTIETCKDETWVWSYGFRELWKPNSFKWGKDIDSFMSWASKGSKLVYFHNLKFDGFFILYWLLKNGFKHTVKKEQEEKTFRTIITKDGLFYQIEVIFKVRKKAVTKCTFQDSYKKLPFTVERIAKSFHLPCLKGSIDYKKVRPKGYEPTKEEIDYLHNDVEIMALALEKQYDEDLEKMTIGADSLNTFKTMLGGGNTKFGAKEFERLFPPLNEETNAIIRKTYKGGFTYVNPKHANKLIENGQVYDVNSLYPSVMYDKPMPFGIPIRFEGEYQTHVNYPLYTQTLTCEFDLKKGYIPTIQLKNNYRFSANQYITSSNGEPVELNLTNVDLKLFFDHYDVKVYEWQGGYMFQSITGVFKEYIDKFMAIKKVEKGAKRELAKLLLNNLYGKFATSTDATRKIPELCKVTGKVLLKQGEREVKKSIYTPVGSFITSYAREITIRSAQKLGDRFIYADTDSLHIVGLDPVDIDIDPVELGKWKHEGDFVRGRFIRAKTYIEEICLNEEGSECKLHEKVTTKTKVTCAGMNDKIKKEVTFDNFQLGQAFYGKLVPKVIKGGVVLVDDYFTIKIH